MSSHSDRFFFRNGGVSVAKEVWSADGALLRAYPLAGGIYMEGQGRL